MTLLLTDEQINKAFVELNGLVIPGTLTLESVKHVARAQLKKDIEELKRIRDDNINIIDDFLRVDLHNLIIRMEVEVEE